MQAGEEIEEPAAPIEHRNYIGITVIVLITATLLYFLALPVLLPRPNIVASFIDYKPGAGLKINLRVRAWLGFVILPQPRTLDYQSTSIIYTTFLRSSTNSLPPSYAAWFFPWPRVRDYEVILSIPSTVLGDVKAATSATLNLNIMCMSARCPEWIRMLGYKTAWRDKFYTLGADSFNIRFSHSINPHQILP